MRRSKEAVKWMLAAALLAMPVGQALADQPVAPTVIDKPTNIKPVPRGIPDLTPYWNFDPPKSPLFDISKFTISGDLRVRAEGRTNANFGVSQTATGRANGQNDFFVQQWARIGLNYSVSQDVDFFVQPQWAKNWGAANNTNGSGAGCGAGGSVCANDAFNNGQADSLFMRQAYIMIRNLGVEGLSIKAGRQLMVMGDHRLFGHFDWANTGFSHDGITFQYNQPKWELWGGWLRTMETDFNNQNAQSTSAGLIPAGTDTRSGSHDSDLFFARFAFKPIAGLAIEPLWVFQHNNASPQSMGTGGSFGTMQSAHANGQDRHTLGARVALRKGMFDGTAEGYWQTGEMNIGQSGQQAHINAYALAAEGGLTFADIPWSPRIGVEFNMASGDGDGTRCNGTNAAANCNGNMNTFENLYPTNHIVMGYADLMAWRNMVAYSASLQVIPFNYAANHLELRYWNFQKQSAGDCWYRAAQNCYFSQNNQTAKHLADEIDVIYTLFFKGNKVAWQTGASYIMAGQFLDNVGNAGATGWRGDAVNQTWAYTQLHINF